MKDAENHKKRNERLQVMLDVNELKIIDSWRFQYRMPSRAVAIRALIREGLKATMSAKDLKDLDAADLPEAIRSIDISISSDNN